MQFIVLNIYGLKTFTRYELDHVFLHFVTFKTEVMASWNLNDFNIFRSERIITFVPNGAKILKKKHLPFFTPKLCTAFDLGAFRTFLSGTYRLDKPPTTDLGKLWFICICVQSQSLPLSSRTDMNRRRWQKCEWRQATCHDVLASTYGWSLLVIGTLQ